MHETYKDRVKLIAIYGISDKESDTLLGTRTFAEEHDYAFPVFFDAGNKLVKKYGVRGFPAAFLVDSKREVVWRGDPRKANVDDAIKQNLPNNVRRTSHAVDPTQLQDKRDVYEGRGAFKLLPKDQPARRGIQSESLKDVRRYVLPMYAAAPKPGQVVADVGAGRGRFSYRLAEAVGDKGKVYCRDIDQSLIATMNIKIKKLGLTNIEAGVSEKNDVNLPEDSIDLTLLSDVYQFVTTQRSTKGFVDSLYRATKPGGIVVVTNVTTRLLFKKDDWEPYFASTIDDFTSRGFEPGQRWILDDHDDTRPMLILEFRRPLAKGSAATEREDK